MPVETSALEQAPSAFLAPLRCALTSPLLTSANRLHFLDDSSISIHNATQKLLFPEATPLNHPDGLPSPEHSLTILPPTLDPQFGELSQLLWPEFNFDHLPVRHADSISSVTSTDRSQTPHVLQRCSTTGTSNLPFNLLHATLVQTYSNALSFWSDHHSNNLVIPLLPQSTLHDLTHIHAIATALCSFPALAHEVTETVQDHLHTTPLICGRVSVMQCLQHHFILHSHPQ